MHRCLLISITIFIPRAAAGLSFQCVAEIIYLCITPSDPTFDHLFIQLHRNSMYTHQLQRSSVILIIIIIITVIIIVAVVPIIIIILILLVGSFSRPIMQRFM
jgi:hypothetical protein